MPFYYKIPKTEEGKRTARHLLALKAQLDKELPKRTVEETLLLATWNIREFDSSKYGPRLQESYYYIAEIVSRFDLVAIQEVRDDLTALKRLMDILGGWWKMLVTDVTEGTAGNRERLAFVYDGRKVNFSGLAGEIVLPPKKKNPTPQIARTPFLCGFRAGWFHFTLCTVHMIWGKGGRNSPERIAEIDATARFLRERSKRPNAFVQEQNYILLGDFNIHSIEDPTGDALTTNGFEVPDAITELPRDKHYDQIAFLRRPDQLELKRAGLVNIFKSVFSEEDFHIYRGIMLKTSDNPMPVSRNGKSVTPTKKTKKKTKKAPSDLKRYYNDWRTHQMSDHCPLWVELRVDFGREYLVRRKDGD